MSEVIVGIAALNQRLDAIGSPEMQRAFMGRLAARALAGMRTRIARKTSKTSQTLHIGTITASTAQILGSPNALRIERGTRPHIIVPKNAKALRFAASASGRRLSGRPRKGATVVFARRVHHPGTKAQPYITASLRDAAAKSGLADVVIEAWNRAA